jgi:two-component system sensor histidine kinase KdpD
MDIAVRSISKKKQYLYGIVTIILTSAACYILSDLIGYRVVAFVLLLIVSVLAVTFDIFPVLLCAALSAFIWDYFFIPPRFNFHVDTSEDKILLTMYFVIALINGILTYKIRQVEKAARLKEEKANSVKLYNTILNSLSHELRTPIAAIIGATDNLQSNTHLADSDKEQLIQEISKASLRLNQQVENLLNLSRLESGHIQPKNDWCDVRELIYDVVQKVEEYNPQRKIGVSIGEHVPLCWLDKVMLEQIVYNLLSNAAIHTKASANIDVSAMCHADVLQIVVEDTGEGFKDVPVKDVFHKFSRERVRKGEHHGLGLSIVKGFTDAIGGTINVVNKKSGGVLFTLYLPVKTTSLKMDEE